MRFSRQTPRSLAVWTLLAALALASVGCSSSDDASAPDSDYGSYGTGQDSGDGDGDGDGETTGTDTSDTGTDTGTDDSGAAEAGPEDPDLDLGSCDPNATQVLAYGLDRANAQAAPVLVREAVFRGDGEVPSIPLSARPFLNQFRFDYEPASGWDLELSGELWQPPMLNAEAPERFRLQYAIRGPAMSPPQRLPVDLAVVVDLGPAMKGEPLALAQEALAALESALRPGDRVSLIAAGSEPALLGTTLIDNLGLEPLTGLLDISPEENASYADVGAALELAYATVGPSWEGQGQARVLLLSNGAFAPTASLLGMIDDHADDGRFLINVGLGDPKLYDDATISALAHEGRGKTLFVADPAQLWLELETSFSANLIAAATEVEVTLTLPPGLAVRQREPYIGAPSDPRSAMLGPNDALVFHLELEACAELSADATIVVEVEWIDPLTGESKEAVWDQPLTPAAEPSLLGLKGAATVAYARALRVIRDGDQPIQGYGAVLDAISLISDALEALPEDPDLLEMSAVITGLL